MGLMRGGAASIGIVLALAAGSHAMAQDQPRPRVTVVVKPPAPLPDQPRLRQPIGLALDQVTKAGRAPPVRSLAATVVAPSNPKAAAPPLRGLNRLSASAGAAQCRVQCGEARYVCTAGEGGDCDSVWGQCVVGCSGVNYKRTPDLVSSAGYRPGL